jgi:hypothetical protein
MKAIATVALVLVVIAASLVCLMSSMCAVSGGISGGSKTGFAVCALVALGVAVGGSMLIGKINRRS